MVFRHKHTQKKASPVPVRAWQLEVLCEVFHVSRRKIRFAKRTNIHNTSCAQAEAKMLRRLTGSLRITGTSLTCRPFRKSVRQASRRGTYRRNNLGLPCARWGCGCMSAVAHTLLSARSVSCHDMLSTETSLTARAATSLKSRRTTLQMDTPKFKSELHFTAPVARSIAAEHSGNEVILASIGCRHLRSRTCLALQSGPRKPDCSPRISSSSLMSSSFNSEGSGESCMSATGNPVSSMLSACT